MTMTTHLEPTTLVLDDCPGLGTGPQDLSRWTWASEPDWYDVQSVRSRRVPPSESELPYPSTQTTVTCIPMTGAQVRSVLAQREAERVEARAKRAAKVELEERQAAARDRLHACRDVTVADDWDTTRREDEVLTLESVAGGSVTGRLVTAHIQGDLVRVDLTGDRDLTTWCRGRAAVLAAREAALTQEQQARGQSWLGGYGDDYLDQMSDLG